MRTVSLRARLTLWYTLTLFVVLCLFGADLWWAQGRLGLRRVDRELGAVIATVANVIEAELKEQVGPAAAAEEAIHEVAAPGRAVVILSANGAPLGSNWNGLQLREPLPTASAGHTTRTAQTPAGPWRLHAETRTFEASTLVLLAASSLSDARREQHEVQEAMVVAIPMALLLAGAGGWWLAAIGLRPLTEMAAQAAQIPLTGMDSLGAPDRTDELGLLARAFNGLVARLRSALQTQRQFMADASHELRTPVSVIRTAADVSLSREHRDEVQYRETLTIVGAQAQRLGRLVADMLVLARADAGGYPLHQVDLYLDELVGDCQRAVGVLAAERGVIINFDARPEIPFKGDEELLRQMMVNVLQNAVQHTPAGGSVTIESAQHDGWITLRVTDTGQGIPPADRTRIFDRFVQLDPARRGNGTGLGLPIAKWIAEAHHGSLVLEVSGPRGSTFSISFPSSADVRR